MTTNFPSFIETHGETEWIVRLLRSQGWQRSAGARLGALHGLPPNIPLLRPHFLRVWEALSLIVGDCDAVPVVVVFPPSPSPRPGRGCRHTCPSSSTSSSSRQLPSTEILWCWRSSIYTQADVGSSLLKYWSSSLLWTSIQFLHRNVFFWSNELSIIYPTAAPCTLLRSVDFYHWKF